jgi:hypothetical protein
MKVKMKLDLASIKSWLLAHGEKLAFAVVGVVFLLFTYAAISREVLDSAKEPDKLKSLASNVQQHVQNSRWDQKREGVQLVDYADRAVVKQVNATHYALPNLFDPPVTDPKGKRTAPEIVAVEDLRVGAGFDVFEVKGAGGKASGSDRSFAAQPWAVVTGVVPLDKQKQAYARAFGNSVGGNADRDVPNYLPPVLERAEVDPANPDKLDWKPVDSAAKHEQTWAAVTEDIVPIEFRDAALTGKLGPLINNRKWGEQVSHPRIHVDASEPKTAEESVAAEGAPAAPTQPAMGRPGAVPAQGVAQRQPPRPNVQQPVSADGKKLVPIRLMRVFDYSVEPGKQYRYRVVLAVANPNFGLPPQHLQVPAAAAQEHLTAKPSEATAPISVPDGHRVLAGAIDPGSRFSEPSATLLVTAIERQEGLEPAVELTKVQRGGLANTPAKTEVQVLDPRSRQPKKISHDFKSSILLLDMYGGDDLPGRRRTDPIRAPGEMLLLTPDGGMQVRNELDDRAPYENSIVRDEPAPKKRAADDKKEKPAKDGKDKPRTIRPARN